MTKRFEKFTSTAALIAIAVTVVAGCDRARDIPNTPLPTTTVGNEIDDTVLTASVKTALIADPNVKSFDFKVETRKGEVQLSGYVDNTTQLARAEEIARSVTGVKSVINSMELKGSPNTMGGVVDDIDVTARVKTALLGDERVKSLDIKVITRKGDAQLSGFVDSQHQIDYAVEIAGAVKGVHTVHNELRIKK
jgi:hyperosmotically inducible protein